MADDETTVNLVYDPKNRSDADAIHARLDQEFLNIAPEDGRPKLEHSDDLEKLPDPSRLGALSLVLYIIPEPAAALSQPQQDKLATYRKMLGSEEVRFVPVNLANPTSAMPAQLADIFAFRYAQYANSRQALDRLAVLVQNLLYLRVASTSRRVFLSYKISDGKDAAKRIEEELIKRGYSVWRDELLDRDGFSQIKAGSSIQKQIESAIVQQGFVLVVDTHDAPKSTWVNEEISLAIRYNLPVLPVVIENPALPAPPKLGGRFKVLRDKQLQVPDRGNVAFSNMDSAFFDDLEATMSTVLLEHFRARRRLVVDAESFFEGAQFSFESVPGMESRLLYTAEKSLDTTLTPRLSIRALCQCAPYDVLLGESVANLSADLARSSTHHQYGVLLHQTPAERYEREQLLTGTTGQIMLLKPDELDQVPLFE